MTTSITVGRDRLAFKVTSDQTGGDVAVVDVTIPAGGGPPLLHRHDPFELYRVRSGELTFYLEGQNGAVTRRVAGPGAVVPIAARLEHTIRNESDEDAQATVVFSPGEPMERFARAAAGARGEEEVMALAETHGIEFTRSVPDALAPRHTAYLTVARFSGEPDRLLDEYRRSADTMSAVGKDHGLILHAGGPTDEGFIVVNLWPSKENSESAAGDPRRLEAVERAGITPAQVDREHYEVSYLLTCD